MHKTFSLSLVKHRFLKFDVFLKSLHLVTIIKEGVGVFH